MWASCFLVLAFCLSSGTYLYGQTQASSSQNSPANPSNSQQLLPLLTKADSLLTDSINKSKQQEILLAALSNDLANLSSELQSSQESSQTLTAELQSSQAEAEKLKATNTDLLSSSSKLRAQYEAQSVLLQKAQETNKKISRQTGFQSSAVKALVLLAAAETVYIGGHLAHFW